MVLCGITTRKASLDGLKADAAVSAMAASTAALAVPAKEVVTGAVKVLSTDIVTIEGKFYRKLKVRVRTGKLTKSGRPQMRTVTQLEPVDVALHANPIGLGVLGILGSLTAFVLFGRVRTGIPLIGEVELYKGPLADEFDAWKARPRKGDKPPFSGF